MSIGSKINFFFSINNIVIVLTTFLLSSCSVVDIQKREGKDFFLKSDNSHLLLGNYSLIDSNASNEQIWIDSISKNTLKYKFFRSDSLINTITLKGKFKNGYFQARRNWETNFIVGPLFWILFNDSTVIGLTNEKDLIFLRSEGIGMAFILIGPIGGASGGGAEDSYKRIK